MRSRVIRFLFFCTIILSFYIACGNSLNGILSDDEQVENTGNNEIAGVVNSEDFAKTVAEALADNCGDHEDPVDYHWDSSGIVKIILNGNTITVSGNGATVDGSKVTITSAGTYSLNGSMADGQIIVDSKDEEIVRLVLNGIDIKCSTSAPINIANAEKAVIVLADNTENYVADGPSYIFEEADEDEPNAALFSKDDLTICGNGSLTVKGNYNDGIASKDGLVINGSTIFVNSIDDGIRGKDYLVVKGGNITINAKGDGLKSDNDEDATKGYISIENGVIDITSGRDAIQGKTDVLITDGQFNLNTGGGSNSRLDESTSAKGIKAVINTIIDDGIIKINSADDAVHSNGSLVINGGSFDISTGDDGIHADSTLGVNGGDIRISNSYEGLESANIQIDNGNIHITSSDDGLNGAGGHDGSGMDGGPGRPGPPGGFAPSGNYNLYINGGYIAINAAGDGIDINGSIVMTGGVVLVDGPVQNMNSALDYDASFKITGGFLLAVGSAGMAQAPGTSSSQYSVLVNFTSSRTPGTIVHLQTSAKKELFTFVPTKTYQSIAFSSPELAKGTSYNMYYGGSSTGTVEDGLYRDGTYTPGTQYTSYTISSIVTKINSR